MVQCAEAVNNPEKGMGRENWALFQVSDLNQTCIPYTKEIETVYDKQAKQQINKNGTT